MIHVQRELPPDGVQAGSGEKREINVKEKKKINRTVKRIPVSDLARREAEAAAVIVLVEGSQSVVS